MNKDPFILGSGPPTRTAEMISRAFSTGWNSAVTKTICLNHKEMVDVSPRIYRLKNGLKNIELISALPAEQWAREINALKEKYPDKTIIASISAEANNTKAWQELAVMMQEAGSNALELNFSCPHGLPEKSMGNTCSDIPEAAASITRAVKEVSKIPVWVKLSPNITSIIHLAGLCVKNGADCITATNTVKGFAGLDISTGKPELPVYGGLSGNMIKPVALKAVSEIVSKVKCPVSASGGVSNWQDAVEFLLLGASSVQVCTEVMFNGYKVIDKLKSGLADYLGEKSIDGVRGASLKYITSFSELDKTVKLKAKIDRKSCINCKKCYISCRDAGYQAIEEDIRINSEKCTGCGLCGCVCPVRCIEMTELFTFRGT